MHQLPATIARETSVPSTPRRLVGVASSPHLNTLVVNTLFLLSSKGEVLAKWAEGKNMKSVKSTAHAEQVLEAVDEKVDAGFSLASIFG